MDMYQRAHVGAPALDAPLPRRLSESLASGASPARLPAVRTLSVPSSGTSHRQPDGGDVRHAGHGLERLHPVGQLRVARHQPVQFPVHGLVCRLTMASRALSCLHTSGFRACSIWPFSR